MSETEKEENNVRSFRFVTEFLNTISNNLQGPAKYFVGFTFFALKNNGSNNPLKWHKYVLIHPFATNSLVSWKYNVFNDKIEMKDARLQVDETFYMFVHSQMVTKQNFLVGKIYNDNTGWSLINDNNTIHIYDKMRNDFFLNVNPTFAEWCKNGNTDQTEFIVELVNPDIYLVPFPLKPIYFTFNLKDESYSYFLKRIPWKTVEHEKETDEKETDEK